MTDSEHTEVVEQNAPTEAEGKPRMGKKTAIDASRAGGGGFFAVDPNQPLIIGYDTKHKQGEHPQWQKRATKPVNQGLVQYMLRFRKSPGVIEVQKDGPNIIVCIGRQRVKAAREANRILAEMGEPPIKILCQVKRGTDLELLAGTISENAQRVHYSALDMARDAQNFINYGGSDEDAASAIGKTVEYMLKLLTLLDLHPLIQQAIDDEELSPSAGFQLTKLTRDEQLVEFEKIKAGAYQPTAKTIDGVVKAIRNTGPVILAPSKGLLRKLYRHKEAKSVLGTERYQMLKWFLGEAQAPSVGGLKSLLDEVSMPKNKVSE